MLPWGAGNEAVIGRNDLKRNVPAVSCLLEGVESKRLQRFQLQSVKLEIGVVEFPGHRMKSLD